MCTLPSLLTLFGFESKNYEKRALATPPTISEDGLNFPKEFDIFFSDNFALRPMLITAYGYIGENIFKTSTSKEVIIGKDNFLFFTQTLDSFTGEDQLSKEEIDQICLSLKAKQNILEGQGIEFLFTVAPNKNTIYPDKMPNRYIKKPNTSNMEKLYAGLDSYDINYVNLAPSLIKANDTYQVYHKLDSHWNNFGAAIAYEDIMNATQGLVPDKTYMTYADKNFTQVENHLGDLGAMHLPASDKRDIQVDYNLEKSYKSKRPIVNLEAIEIITQNENADKRAIIYRDSFFNAQINFFSNNYGYVQYSRKVPYDFTIPNAVSADIVILEIVERNIPLLLENLN